CTLDDLADARRVAWKLDIPHFVLNMESEFREMVVTPFVNGYVRGNTPSPCVLCNTHVKFALLHQKAFAVGAEKIATGHYARIIEASDGRLELRKARDLSKDQSYFLFELTQEQLGDALFPLGELQKAEVRKIAAEGDLPVADKSDSFEICFVPQKDGYARVVEREAAKLVAAGVNDPLLLGAAERSAGGDLVDVEGRVVGHHEGYYNFTVGQRRGLNTGGAADRTYVLDIDPKTRRVTVGEGHRLEKTELMADRIHWIGDEPPGATVEVSARVRSRQSDIAATVEPLSGGRARVTFAAPLRAVAPGQAVVFYQDDLCLGGGWIVR
ncbi:MAG: tRNA 2-thiouridine(34) synthase MnmA, partial [Acidobacteriota bacterium]